MGLMPHDNLDPWDDGREERRMRTTERTLDTLRSYRVPSPSEMQEIYLDLRDLAAMEKANLDASLTDPAEDEGLPCPEDVESATGHWDPSGPGVPDHCAGCGCNYWEHRAAVYMQRLAAMEREREATIGVGDGSGDLFVHGKYEAVKRVQAILDERDAAVRERDAARGQIATWLAASTPR